LLHLLATPENLHNNGSHHLVGEREKRRRDREVEGLSLGIPYGLARWSADAVPYEQKKPVSRQGVG
jgi:hypothetical protein